MQVFLASAFPTWVLLECPSMVQPSHWSSDFTEGEVLACVDSKDFRFDTFKDFLGKSQREPADPHVWASFLHDQQLTAKASCKLVADTKDVKVQLMRSEDNSVKSDCHKPSIQHDQGFSPLNHLLLTADQLSGKMGRLACRLEGLLGDDLVHGTLSNSSTTRTPAFGLPETTDSR